MKSQLDEIDLEKLVDIVLSTKSIFMDQQSAKKITAKGAVDFVTQTDFQIQNIIQNELSRLYPSIQMMGEEKDNIDLDPDAPMWILDPVDGTTNLIHDFHHSAISLALAVKKDVIIGIIYLPFEDELFYAQKNKGAYLNEKVISVSSSQSLQECLVGIGTNPYNRNDSEITFTSSRKIFDECQDIRCIGSAAMALAYVACGRLDAFFERNLKPWDYAAGILLINEAHGTVTDLDGEMVSIAHASDIVASNRIIHQQLMKCALP